MTPQEDQAPSQRTCSTTVPYSSGSITTRSHIVCEAIGQELVELDAKEKVDMEPISRRRLELRRLRNPALPIHKLPSELLTKIFTELPYTPCRRRDLYPDGQPEWLDLGWLCLMLVCRHWRDLLLSTPVFWWEVNSKRQASWRNLFLSRSAAGSIDVYIQDCSFSRLDDIRPHTHRFGQLHFSRELDNAPVITALATLFNGGMPLLEKLHFTVGTWHTSTLQIDARITSQRFPSLRALSLDSAIMAVPQEISLYAQLRELRLDGCSPLLSFDGFLDVLAASVQLEELHLHRGVLHHLSCGWTHGGPVPHKPPVSLPRLRDFALGEYRIDRVACFLAHLHLRPSAVLWIQGRVSGVTVNTIDAMLPPNRSAALPVLGLATNAHVSRATGPQPPGRESSKHSPSAAISVAHPTSFAGSMVVCPNLKSIDIEGTSTVATYEAICDCFLYRGAREVALESLRIKSLIDSDDMASASRRGFIGDVSGVVRSIEVGYGLLLLEGVEQPRDDGWYKA